VITTEDINARVVTAVGAQTAIAGKAWPERGPDEPDAYPYCVFTLRASPAALVFGSVYFQHWQVQAAVYVPVGSPSPINVEGALSALNTALTIRAAVAIGTLRNPGERVMSVRPVTGQEKYDPYLRAGKDVLVAAVTADWLCQGDRSVA
jgi:hypothetical protein